MKCNRLLIILLSVALSASMFMGCAVPFSKKSADTGSRTLTEQDDASAVSFDEFLDHFFRSEVSSNTINLHFTLSNPQNYGIDEMPITLGDISIEAQAKSQAQLENTLAALNSYDYSTLQNSQKLTYDVLSDYLTTQFSVSDLMLYDEILRPSTGIAAQLPVLYEEYRFYDKSDIEDYLKLIALTDSYFEQIIAFEQQKASARLFMSDFACDTIISQCEAFIQNPDEHYLIVTFHNKLNAMTSLTDEERLQYEEENASLVRENILPAYKKLATALSELLGSGTNDMGLCYLPDGKRYYEYLVYQSTGSSKSINELLTAIGDKRTDDLTNATALMLKDPDLQEKANNVSLEGMDAIATLNTLRDKMLQDFPAAPDTEFTVSYIDESMEDYMAPAFYITSPIDYYEKNSIFINASTDTSSMRYFTTLAHEGFPGHLYQTVMSYQAGLPAVRSILNYPGYVEGWATYVEMLSYHYAGLDESVAELLALNQSALLSLYATSDIGIHYEGWTFADTVDFWSEYGITDSNALRDVYELIVEEPAHYLKYYVGYLEFLELKEKAQKTYGSDYSDTAFHQTILDIGPAPFSMIEKYFNLYYKQSLNKLSQTDSSSSTP